MILSARRIILSDTILRCVTLILPPKTTGRQLLGRPSMASKKVPNRIVGVGPSVGERSEPSEPTMGLQPSPQEEALLEQLK